MVDSIGHPWAFLLLLIVPFVFYRAVRSYADRSGSAKLGIAGLRSAICVLLVLELVGITFWWKGKAGDEHIAYVVDVSDSVTLPMREHARDQVARATEDRGDDENASLVLFGDSPLVAIPFGEGMDREKIAEAFGPFMKSDRVRDPISGNGTNLERAIQAALSGFPAKAQKRIVLITDGNQTDGDSLQLASAASGQYVQICCVPLQQQDSRDVVVASLSVPERIKREEAFEIECEVHSAGEIQGRLKLYVDDYLAVDKEVALAPGKHVETFRRSLEEGGDHLLQVHFESDTPQATENDKAFVYITIPGRPRVLIVSKSDVTPLANALRRSRFRVEHLTPAGAPATMLELSRYDAVILGDVPADALGKLRLRLLRDYVANLGRGLVLTGGRESFGPGGYAGTPVEQAAPVRMEISQKERPSTAVVVLVDDSRSMWLHGTPEMTFEKELFTKPGAAYTGLSTKNKAEFIAKVFERVVLSLSDRDQVGALGLTSQLKAAEWYVRLQRVTDKPRLITQFNRGFKRQRYSILIDSVNEARFYLANDPATYKQVLLLTDGYVAADEDYYKLAQIFLSDGFSISTVGVGSDSNVKLLEELARWGGGRFFLASDMKEIGDVYEKELTAPTTQLIVERASPISLMKDTEVLRGLDMNLAPDLFGYVRTQAKTTSDTLLTVEGTKDPILASWQYRAGKVIAFTSSAVGSWATLWTKDWEDGYSRFWRQVVRGVLQTPGEQTYRVHLKPEGMRVKVAADVLDTNENFINAAQVTAKLYYLGERGDIFSPSVSWKSRLKQVAPGRYEHKFEMEREGVYLATVQGADSNATSIASSGAIIPTPKELINPDADQALLAAISQTTKGQLAADAAEAAGAEGLEERRRYDLGYSAVILAALLLILEILVRRWPAIVGFYRARSTGNATRANASALTCLLLSAFITPAFGEPLSPEDYRKADPNLLSDKPIEMALSAASQKKVEKYMNLVLGDPQNEFAFGQVYEIYESEKKTWKLLEFFQNAARLQREDANLQLLLGMMYVRFRDYYKATEHFLAALKLMPESYYGRLRLGRVFIKRADAEKAREHLAEAIKVASSTEERVEALFLLGDALMMDEKLDAAKKAWAEIFDTQRFDVPTLQRLAHTYQTYKQPEPAEQMLKEVLDLAKTNQKLKCRTLIALSDLRKGQGDLGAAIERLREAQKLLLPNSARRREVEDRIRELYREDERIAEFFEDLEQQVSERSNDVNLRKEIARLYTQEGQLEKAAGHLEHGLGVDSRDVLLLEKATEVNTSLGKMDTATELYDRLYDITSGAPTYLFDKGELLWQQEKTDEAEATWKRITSEGEPSADRYEAVIRAYRKHDLKEQAVGAYGELLDLFAREDEGTEEEQEEQAKPEVEEARLAFADYLLSLERQEESLEHFNALTDQGAASATLFLQIADIYADHDLDEKLLELLNEASERHPEDHRIAKRRGNALERLQKHPEAIKAFYAAYDHAPNWREKEMLMEKLISLHLAYGTGGGSLNRLGSIIYKLYEDIMRNREDPEPYVGIARVSAVYRPAVERHAWGTHISVPGLAELTKGELRGAYFTMGQITAVGYYQRALERDPMRIDAYLGRSRCYMFFDEFERAVMEFKKLAIVNPVGKWKYYFAIGDMFASQGQMPEARAFWDRVAERAFTDATLYFRLATRNYWAGRPEMAISLLRKAISIYPDDYRYHLVFGNVLTDQKRYAEAISEYREALRLSIHTMLLPVRRSMYRAQVKYAHELFEKQEYARALDVYQEIKKFQEVLNKHLGKTVPEYPDTLVQIARTEAKVAGGRPDKDAYAQVAKQFPDARCWVSDHLVMSAGYLAALEAQGGFEPRMSVPVGKTERKLPGIRKTYSVRVYPWVARVTLSPERIHLARRFSFVELDPKTGRTLAEDERRGSPRYFGYKALVNMTWYEVTDATTKVFRHRHFPAGMPEKLAPLKGRRFLSSKEFHAVLTDTLTPKQARYVGTIVRYATQKKLVLREIASGKTLWETDGNWGHDSKANSKILIGMGNGNLQAIEISTGKMLWEIPRGKRPAACEDFTVTEQYVTLKQLKAWIPSTGGLEAHAFGDTEAIGYVFKVLDAMTGEVIFERESSGSHYWRVPVIAGDSALLTDGFARLLYAYDLRTGKLRWTTSFDSFFAAPPMVINGEVHMYMRRPKLKTIIQYVLDPISGDIKRQTDLKVNSLYTDPIVIGKTIFFYDPVKYELIGVDAETGGVTGRVSILKFLPAGSHLHVITLDGQGNSIFIYTQDGLVVRMDVQE